MTRLAIRRGIQKHLQLSFSLFFFVLFCFLVVAVERGFPFVYITNAYVYDYVVALYQEGWKSFFVYITDIGLYGALAVTALLSLFLSYKKRYRQALYITISMGGAICAAYAVKYMLGTERPPFPHVSEHGFAFPSGHTTIVVAFFSLLYALYGHRLHEAQRIVYVLSAVLVAGAVGFSRLYLNVHWFFDVMGGIYLGIAIPAMAHIFLKRFSKSAQPD